MGTEEKAQQELEAILNEPSTEDGPVSEDQTEEVEESKEEPEDEKTTKKPAKEEKPDPELEKLKADPRIKKWVQSERDKQVNTYREQHESNSALIKNLSKQLTDERAKNREKADSLALQDILANDAENGMSEEDVKKKEARVKEYTQRYNQGLGEIEDAAAISKEVAGKISKEVAAQFNLNDANPSLRAKGIAELIGDATYFIEERKAFNRILEEIPILQNGSEVRAKIDSFIKDYMELKEQKGRDLLVERLKQDVRIVPRKKPSPPSGTSGGKKTSFTREEIAKMSPEDYKANKAAIEKAYMDGKIK